MLAAVAVVGIGAALWVAKPSWQVGAVEALLLALLPATAAMMSVSSTGKARAFWIGVTSQLALTTILMKDVFPTGWFVLDADNDQFYSIRGFVTSLSFNFHNVLLFWLSAPVVGVLCAGVHWLLIRPPQGPKG
jgi:hypothetical protein